MANEAVMGLMEELGLGPVNEQEAITKAIGSTQDYSGFGQAGLFAQIGADAGRNIAPVLAAGIGAIGKDRTFRGQLQRNKDIMISRGLGMTLPEYQKYKQSREAVSNLDLSSVASTGDPLKDQQAALSKIISVAQAEGNTDLMMKAQAKQVQLSAQQLELKKLSSEQRRKDREEEGEIEDDSVGRTVIMQGDPIDGAHSKAMYDLDTGKWKVIRPNGDIKEGVDGLELTFVDPESMAIKRASLRDRQFETRDGAMKNALAMNGLTGQSITKTRSNVSDMGEQANIVKDMTSSLLSMHNPAIAFSDSRAIAVAGDRVFTLGNTITSLFSRKGEKAYIAKPGEFKSLTDVEKYEDALREQGLNPRDVLPAHIQADTQEAQLFMANVMQLAYLDARIQEPSNRGLSDNDIKAALQRIGAYSPDPTVFARRQLQNLNRIRGKLNNLGTEFSGTSQIKKDELIGFVYRGGDEGVNPLDRIEDALDITEQSINDFLSGGQEDTVLSPVEDSSRANRIKELEEEIARRRAAGE